MMLILTRIKYLNNNQEEWNKSKMFVVQGLLENDKFKSLAILTLTAITSTWSSKNCDIVIQNAPEFTFILQ